MFATVFWIKCGTVKWISKFPKQSLILVTKIEVSVISEASELHALKFEKLTILNGEIL